MSSNVRTCSCEAVEAEGVDHRKSKDIVAGKGELVDVPVGWLATEAVVFRA